MIFSELYSAYYNAVARILTAASRPGVTEQTLQQIVMDQAFSESTLTILPSLRSGKWPLLRKDLTSILYCPPTMPLTLLEKRWLKSLLDDPRLQLFGIAMPELEDVKPLFTQEDYRIFDQYGDGDPYEDPHYIQVFRLLLDAIKTERPVAITMRNRFGKIIWARFYPTSLEYSAKDDKFRVLSSRSRFREFNLSRILTCEYYDGTAICSETPLENQEKVLTLLVTEERNTLERAMLHFAHFEKRTQRTDDGNYLLHLKYQQKDESELVIRVLSFGPLVKVVAPEPFLDRIKEKLTAQKSCEL